MMTELLDRATAARRLSVSVMTVRRLGRAGDLDEVRVGKRSVRVTAQSVAAYIAARTKTREEAHHDD